MDYQYRSIYFCYYSFSHVRVSIFIRVIRVIRVVTVIRVIRAIRVVSYYRVSRWKSAGDIGTECKIALIPRLLIAQ